MSILENFDKKSLGLFFILYLIVLFRYFIANNIPIQFDSRIIILVVISFVFIILIGISVYFLAGAIERLFLFSSREESKHKIFTDFDQNVSLILFPIFIVFFLLNLGNELRIYHLILTILLIIHISLLNIFAKKPKVTRWMYLNSVVITLLFFYVLFGNYRIFLISLLFLSLIILTILYYLKSNETFFNEKLALNLDDSILYIIFKTKFAHTFSFFNSLKIGSFTLIIIISIIFFAWDTILTKNKASDFITQKVLNITKIGSFKEKLIIDNKLKNEFIDKAKNINENNFTLEAEIIWKNDNDVFIKYNNTNRRIKKEYILMSEY